MMVNNANALNSKDVNNFNDMENDSEKGMTDDEDPYEDCKIQSILLNYFDNIEKPVEKTSLDSKIYNRYQVKS